MAGTAAEDAEVAAVDNAAVAGENAKPTLDDTAGVDVGTPNPLPKSEAPPERLDEAGAMVAAGEAAGVDVD